MSQRRSMSEKTPGRRGSRENNSVNSTPPAPIKPNVLEVYRTEIDRLGYNCQTVSAVVFAAVKAVCSNVEELVPLDTPPNQYICYSDSSIAKLPTSGENSTFSSIFREVLTESIYRADAVAIERDNEIEMSQLQCSLKAASGVSNRISLPTYMSNVFTFEKMAALRNQINRLICVPDGFPVKPEDSMTDRSIKESELLTFTSLAATDLYKYHQLHEAESLLNQVANPLPNFTGLVKSEGEGGNICKRRYVRHLSALAFSQILSKEMIKDPVVLRKYYSLSDQMLYVLCWPPPDRRMDKKTIALAKYLSRSTVTVDPAVTERSTARRKSFEKPPTTGRKSIDITNDLEKIVQNVITITPAGKAMVKMQSTSSSVDAWLTVYLDGCVLGHCAVIPIGGRPKKERRKSKENSVVPPAPAPAPPPEPAPAPAPAPPPEPAAKGKKGKDDKKAGGGKDKDKKGAGKEPEPAPVVVPEPAPVEVVAEPVPEVVPVEVEEEEPVEEIPEDPQGSIFFCQTEDGIRILSCKGPSPTPCLKPDSYGTVMLSVIYPSGLDVTACSNGSIKYSSTNPGVIQPAGLKEPLGIECMRYIVAGGTVVRIFQSGPIAKDILCPDGTRTLIARVKEPVKVEAPPPMADVDKKKKSPPGTARAPLPSQAIPEPEDTNLAAGSVASAVGESIVLAPEPSQLTAAQSLDEDDEIDEPENSFSGSAGVNSGFLAKLFAGVRDGWKYIRLTPEGYADFFYCSPGTVPEPAPLRHPTLPVLRRDFIDAESGAACWKFDDDRAIVFHSNGQREVTFPDQTVIITHPDKSTIHVRRGCQGIYEGSVWELPSVEVDSEVDKVCRDHSRGLKIPINKGGEQTRFKIALPDGSALMIKYNTNFVSPVNGSVKLVRRDRTRIIVSDDGELQYCPPSTWDDKAALEWSKETADSSAMWRDMSGIGISQASSSMTLASHSDARSPTRRPEDRHSSSIFDTKTKKGKKKGLTDPSTDSIISRTSIEKDILVSNKVVDLKFCVNLSMQKCFIQDSEHNSFELSLRDPLNPIVSLAGEVDGLLPTAVTDNPIEPRVFIVSRTAEATEVLPLQYIADVEKQADLCPDLFKTKTEVLHQPAELGNAYQLDFYLRSRLGLSTDKYSFTDVFGERAWLSLRSPATAILNSLQVFEPQKWKASVVRSTRSTSPAAVASSQPQHFLKIYQTLTVEEQMPLSSEGYMNLLGALDNWQKFRTARVATINRFDIADNRSESELELEEKIRGKLKQAYKIAKIAAQKKKDKEREHRESQPLDLNVNAKIVEGEEGEEDEESVEFSEDERDLDPEELEIRAAFEAYSSLPEPSLTLDNQFTESSMSLSEENVGPVIPSLLESLESKRDAFGKKKANAPKPIMSVGQDLRAALIQLFNVNIPMSLVEKALMSEGMGRTQSLLLADFKIIYFRVNALLNPPPGTGMSHGSDLEGYQSNVDYAESPPRVPIIPMDLDSPGVGVGSLESSTGDVSAYWNSPHGHASGKLIPTSAPPINFRPLKWNHQSTVGASVPSDAGIKQTSKSIAAAQAFAKEDDMYAEDGFLENEVIRTGAATVPAPPGIGASGMFPAGSALRAARTAALH